MKLGNYQCPKLLKWMVIFILRRGKVFNRLNYNTNIKIVGILYLRELN